MKFQNGDIVQFQSVITDKNLRSDPQGKVTATGGSGNAAKWEVTQNADGSWNFRNVEQNHYLRLTQTAPPDCVVKNSGGQWALWRFETHDDHVLIKHNFIQSDKGGCYLVVQKNGDVVRKDNAHHDKEARYHVKVVESRGIPSGSKLRFTSHVTKQNLRSDPAGKVTATGGTGNAAQWEYTVNDDGSVNLKNIEHGHYLRQTQQAPPDCVVKNPGGQWALFRLIKSGDAYSLVHNSIKVGHGGCYLSVEGGGDCVRKDDAAGDKSVLFDVHVL